MERISIFDMFKIGIGPSSSHTMGPWRAAQRFVQTLREQGRLEQVQRVSVELFGSLAKTGKGHGTDIAVQLGLSGEDPVRMDTALLQQKIATIADTKTLRLGAVHALSFDPVSDIVFHFDRQLPHHPNALTFCATLTNGERVELTCYSVGGGFIECEGEVETKASIPLPFPVDSAKELMAHCHAQECNIPDILFLNEQAWRSEAELRNGVQELWEVMLQSIYRGCHTEGELGGGLGVKRRAAEMNRQLLGHDQQLSPDIWLKTICGQAQNIDKVMNWISCFALAVNEENAAYGRIVTAPTNGSAGVIPAVLLYALCFGGCSEEDVLPFLLTAGEIGCIFKKRATISAAMGGCQAEIGVSSSMAAAALTVCRGGCPEQAAVAAEIAMEHHLGLTCDPVGGLVQIPCIERNAFGAVKAITASQLALQRDPDHARVSLDEVIQSMWETALDMNSKYKETSEGGLAINIPVNVIEC